MLALGLPGWILIVALGLIVLVWLLATLVAVLAQRRLMWVYRTNRRPKDFERARRGGGHGIDELFRRTKLDPKTLEERAPRYTKRAIPKRRGGHRILLVPDDETKRIQQQILRRLLAKLGAHPAATGFEQGKSIVHHARPHVGKDVVVKMDVIDFFPSTTAERVDAYFRRVGWDAECAALLTKWTTFDGGLPQGAPTSPRLSNLVNYYLDVQLTTIARRRGADYTRYADDIALSFGKTTPKRVRGTMQIVRRLLRGYGYEAHGAGKTRVELATQRQVVTGLVVNAKVNLPRRTRHWLRAVKHHRATGRPMTLTERQLEGWIAFEQMVATQRTEGGVRH